MLNEKFVIHLIGPSCSGKSYLSEALGEQLPDLYIVAFDRLKRQLSGYHRDKHSSLIKEIEFDFFQVIAGKGLPMTFDYFCENEREYLEVRKTAEQKGYKFIPIELTAPREVLLERFHQRLEKTKREGTKISVDNEPLFLKNLEIKSFVPAGTPLFDTATMPVDQITAAVINLL